MNVTRFLVSILLIIMFVTTNWRVDRLQRTMHDLASNQVAIAEANVGSASLLLQQEKEIDTLVNHQHLLLLAFKKILDEQTNAIVTLRYSPEVK